MIRSRLVALQSTGALVQATHQLFTIHLIILVLSGQELGTAGCRTNSFSGTSFFLARRYSRNTKRATM